MSVGGRPSLKLPLLRLRKRTTSSTLTDPYQCLPNVPRSSESCCTHIGKIFCKVSNLPNENTHWSSQNLYFSIQKPPSPILNGAISPGLPYHQMSIQEQRSAEDSPCDTRPIYPNLPYSPYGSPGSSPRVRRKPLRETKRVNSIVQSDGEYVQLNQYKLEQAIGQVRYSHSVKREGRGIPKRKKENRV